MTNHLRNSRPGSKYSQSGFPRRTMQGQYSGIGESESDMFGDGDILNKSSEMIWQKTQKREEKRRALDSKIPPKGPRMLN